MHKIVQNGRIFWHIFSNIIQTEADTSWIYPMAKNNWFDHLNKKYI